MNRLSAAAAGLLVLLCVFSCRSEAELTASVASPESVRVLNANISDNYLQQGIAYIKVSGELAAEFEASTSDDGTLVLPEVKSVADAFSSLGITRMKRLFPYAGKFEERTRAEGLHLWYEVRFDETRAKATKATADLSAIPGVKTVELCPEIEIVGNPVVTERLSGSDITPSAASSSLPFNDPKLGEQWHYYNDGTVKGSQSGCDVNVVPVWKSYTTGSEDVIVAVVDQGVDYTHEDLADNMWKNPEKTGEGQDCGYNFCSDGYKIHPGDHGTHVAGTIAAVNNNGIGVCGLAGGDAAKGVKGVKIMSCQIFDGNSSGSGVSAIKWGADHGAVIAQNSWGPTSPGTTSDALKGAVDYFVKYAGADENGKQTGPIAGGLVVFAAGNDDSVTPYGNDYEKMIIVASLGADYCRAYYSNYGDWVHIAAPGGDAQKGNQVFSTLTGNSYGKMQGTSMACPHVSGVAALVIAAKGGKGVTADAIRKRLEENVTDVTVYNRNYYVGAGLVNAYKAIAGAGGKAPDKVKEFSLEPNSNNITVTVKVPDDSDDGTPNTIMVYYDTKTFSKTDGLMFSQIYVGDVKAGGQVSGVISGLDFNRKYYVGCVACDLAGNMSALSDVKPVTTGGNNPPFITPEGPTEFTLKPHETANLKFKFGDPDGHFVTIKLEEDSCSAILDTMDMDNPSLKIVAAQSPTGTYNGRLTVDEYYGLSATLDFKYTVLENHKPEVVEAIPDQIYSKKGQKVELDESVYIKDEDGEQLSYSIVNSDETVANVNYSKGKFYITSLGFGQCEVTITATDVRGETAVQTFRILVRDSTEPVDVYPNPVSDYLYVRAGEAQSAGITIVNSTGGKVYDQTHTLDPFSPAKIDVTAFAGGVYTVMVDLEDQTIKKTVVKI